ncbi:MAG: hypothetical protein K6F44_06915 [Lachnospiraceae bacterium]|nr:hypothetical protein [Lachnospiraceae bacterium]
MKLRHIFLITALALIFLIFVRPDVAQAALKPSLIEEKVILYTDSQPYVFRIINLDSDAKLTLSSSNESVIKIRDSKAVPLKKGNSRPAAMLLKRSINERLKICRSGSAFLW